MRKPAVFFILFLLLSCEKDDICVDGNTPLLIIRFYDKDTPDVPKAVTGLRVTGNGITNPLSTVNRITTDSIAIPLRSSDNMTIFSFIQDSEDDENGLETGNTDRIEFQYENDAIFISRACGYIANYSSLSAIVENDSDLWIVTTEIINTTIADEDTAHIKIYH